MKDLILPYQQTKKMKERNIPSKRPSSSHFQAARGLTVSVPDLRVHHTMIVVFCFRVYSE